MKRVLILAYDFHPYNSIGAHRPWGWFRYLRSFGIEPVVVTRHWDITIKEPIDCFRPSIAREKTLEKREEGTIIRVPFNPNKRDKLLLDGGVNSSVLKRKMLSFYLGIAQYYLPSTDNRYNIIEAADEYLSSHSCDAIIATGEPFILFKYAHQLSKKHGIPWISDYRDGWSLNYNIPRSGMLEKITSFITYDLFLKRLEKKLLRSCSLSITAAPVFKKQIEELNSKTQVEVIYNGFFEEPFQSVVPTVKEDPECFEIGYLGTIYPYQELEVFLAAFRTFIQNNPGIKTRITFYAADFYPQQKERIMRFDETLHPYIETTGRLDHQEVINKIALKDALLLLANSNISQIYAKVFDYIALNKWIFLVVNDHDSLEAILKDSQSGLICENEQDVVTYLENLYGDFKQGQLKAPPSEGTDKYNRRTQAGELAELIAELC